MLHPYGLSWPHVSVNSSYFSVYDVVIGKFLNDSNKHGILKSSKDIQSITEALGTQKTFYNILRHAASEMNRQF